MEGLAEEGKGSRRKVACGGGVSGEGPRGKVACGASGGMRFVLSGSRGKVAGGASGVQAWRVCGLGFTE